MATSEAADLARVVLLLGSIVTTDAILELSENRRYEFKPPEDNDDGTANWKGVQSEELDAPFFRLTFGEHMYSPKGWLVGSSDDTDKCDF